MSINVIVEFQAKPGMRAELLQTLEAIIAEHGADLAGYLGSTRYEVVDQPDLLVEIAEWESVEAQREHVTKAMATGAFAPLMALAAAPFKVTVMRALG